LNCYILGVDLLLYVEIKIPISKKTNKSIKDQTMLRTLTIILTILATAHCLANPPVAQQDAPAPRIILAFPGAEGYGRFAQGGRGGDVYHVTNINDSGPGSFREGVDSAKGPRTIVFDVSGTIKLEESLNLTSSNVTIAGQRHHVQG
jgi:hypothetical protein